MIVEVDELLDRLPGVITPHVSKRAAVLLNDAELRIEEAFLSHGRNLYKELEDSRLLELTVKRIILDMAAAAITIGDSAGVKSLTSQTGTQSDTIVYDSNRYVSFAGVRLLDEYLEELGLLSSSGPRATFRGDHTFPEVVIDNVRNRRHYRRW